MKKGNTKRVPLTAGAAVGLLAVCLLATGIGFAIKRGGEDTSLESQPTNSTSDSSTTTTTITTSGTQENSSPSTEPNDTTISDTAATEGTQTSTTTTTTTNIASAPDSYMLEVPFYTQNDLLPTGCELVSAKMVMEYYGVTPSIDDIVKSTFSKYTYMADGKNYGYHPNDAFIGSPWDETSFGCFPPVMSNMMNKFLPAGKTAEPLEGESLETLAKTYLPTNTPVMVWATMYMKETYGAIGWYLLDSNGNRTDEWYFWPAREHCLVLVGYDENNYYFNDPMQKANVSWPRELVEQRYEDMGSRALVVVNTTAE